MILPAMIATAMVFGAGSNSAPTVGSNAPEFRAQSTGGTLELRKLRGKWVVLYFYPKSFTPGCTAEACSLRDGFESLRTLNAVVIGVSTDDLETQQRFKKEHNLPFELIADTDKRVVNAYGTSGMLGFTKRWTFIIDPEGIVRAVIDDVDTRRHAEQVRTVLAKLQQNK
jgi:peroxiredoxin Q/BCP